MLIICYFFCKCQIFIVLELFCLVLLGDLYFLCLQTWFMNRNFATNKTNHYMKFKFLTTFVFAILASSLNAKSVELRYVCKYIDPTPLALKRKRVPPVPVVADQNQSMIIFPTFCAQAKIEIVFEEMVVFSTLIDENGCVELPKGLDGEYKLRLYLGDSIYEGFDIL